MKKYFKISVLLVILILTFCIAVSAAYGWETYDYSTFNSSEYLYDIGRNFNNIDMNYYDGVLNDMSLKYGIDYVFIIVNDYILGSDDDSVWDLAALVREKAGYSEDFISVVITTGPIERDFAVFTLGKGQQVMNDSYVDGMWEAILVDLKNNDWDGALYTFIDLAEKMTESYINDTDKVTDRRGNTIYYKQGYYIYDNDGDSDWNYKDHYTFIDFMPVGTVVIVCVIIGLVISLIAVGIEYGKHKPVKKAVNADYYVKDENVQMNVVKDSFLRSHETRTRINTSSGGGSGRSGGSTRTGSSGRSGGGRSGRF